MKIFNSPETNQPKRILGSEEQRRYFSQRTLGMLIVFVIGASGLLLLLQPTSYFGWMRLVTVLIIGLLGFVLLKYRQVGVLMVWLPAAIWGMVTIFALVDGGIRSPIISVYILVVIFAGFTRQSRSTYIFAGLSLGASTLIYLFERWGVVTYAPTQGLGNYWIVLMGGVLGAAFLVNVMDEIVSSAIGQAEKESERYNALFNHSNDGIYIISAEGLILSVNQRGADMLGFQVEDLIGKTIYESIIRGEHDEAQMKLNLITSDELIPIYERTLVNKIGEFVPVEINLTLVKNNVGEPLYVQSVIRDIKRRKATDEERADLIAQAQQANKNLQSLSRQIVRVQEAERQFIARELHDEIGQILTGLKILLESELNLQADKKQETSHLTRAISLSNELMTRVRELSLDLRPMMLDDLGLLPALEWMFERYTFQTGIDVIFDHAQIQDMRFGLDVETAMYRVIQEATNNVARHANVSYVYVYLKEQNDVLIATVKDTGLGMDMAEQEDVLNKHAGIAGMQERVALLGGSVQFHSKPDQGVVVTASIPADGGFLDEEN